MSKRDQRKTHLYFSFPLDWSPCSLSLGYHQDTEHLGTNKTWYVKPLNTQKKMHKHRLRGHTVYVVLRSSFSARCEDWRLYIFECLDQYVRTSLLAMTVTRAVIIYVCVSQYINMY